MNYIEKASTQKEMVEALKVEVMALRRDLEALTTAIVESAHIMGWPKDLLRSHGIRAFDKQNDKLKIRQ